MKSCWSIVILIVVFRDNLLFSMDSLNGHFSRFKTIKYTTKNPHETQMIGFHDDNVILKKNDGSCMLVKTKKSKHQDFYLSGLTTNSYEIICNSRNNKYALINSNGKLVIYNYEYAKNENYLPFFYDKERQYAINDTGQKIMINSGSKNTSNHYPIFCIDTTLRKSLKQYSFFSGIWAAYRLIQQSEGQYFGAKKRIVLVKFAGGADDLWAYAYEDGAVCIAQGRGDKMRVRQYYKHKQTPVKALLFSHDNRFFFSAAEEELAITDLKKINHTIFREYKKRKIKDMVMCSQKGFFPLLAIFSIHTQDKAGRIDLYHYKNDTELMHDLLLKHEMQDMKFYYKRY